MLKVELHVHSSEDPYDKGFDYDARKLIDKASEQGFNALALTNHMSVTHTKALEEYAKKRKILLIPGCEHAIGRMHILFYGISEPERVAIKSFEDLRALRKKKPSLLCIAPHPCFPSRNSLGRKTIEQNADLFDAIELSQYGEGAINMNRRAERLAKKLGKPLVATSDAHSFEFFGRCYALVDAKPTVSDVLESVRKGKVENVMPPLGFKKFSYVLSHAVLMRILRNIGVNEHRAF